MALITDITGKLLSELSGGGAKSSSSATGSSTINGKGAGASFGSAANLSGGLSALSTAFQESALRLNTPITVFEFARNTLTQLLSLTDDLIALSRRAAAEQTSDAERGSINTLFQNKVSAFRQILSAADRAGIDFRDKNELADVLKNAGVDTSAATALSEFFKELAPLDNELGYSRIRGSDATVDALAYTTAGDGTFRRPVSVMTAGFEPSAVRLYDFDGDGKLDLFVGDDNLAAFGIHLGNGNGTFQTASSYNSGGALVDVAFGEFSGDTSADILASIQVGRMNDGTFTAPTTLAGSYFDVATADVNHDTGVDLVAVNGPTAYVFISNGDGTFLAAHSYTAGVISASHVRLADLNRDGNVDLIGADDSGYTVALGNADGSFGASTFIGSGDIPFNFTLADMDGDGNLDILGSTGGNFVEVLRGQGDGTFHSSQIALATSSIPPYSAVGADFTGDGILDVVSGDDTAFYIAAGLGGGSFAAARSFSPGHYDVQLYTADINHDGFADLINNDGTLTEMGVLLGNGDGTFKAQVTYSTGNFSAYHNELSDLDGDGNLDFVGTSSVQGKIKILFGNDDGTFRAVYSTSAAGGALTFAIADFNLDGRNDIATAAFGGIGINLGIAQSTATTFGPTGSFSLGSPNTQPTFSTPELGDVDRDGNLDLLTISGTKAYIGIGRGDGTFASSMSFVTGTNNYSEAELADVDRDGILDLLLVNDTDTATLRVMLGNSNGTFKAVTSFGTVASRSLVMTDVNRDGKLDAVTGTLSSGFSVLFGNGDGSFLAGVSHSSPVSLDAAEAGDFNEDGKIDLAFGSASDSVLFYYGDGTGSFTAPLSLVDNAFAPALGIDSGDLDHDGHLDLVRRDFFGSFVYRGNGDGTFLAGVSIPDGAVHAPSSENFLLDLNRDGNLDIAGEDGFRPGNGDGTFKAYTYLSTGAASAAWGDLNHDGAYDSVEGDSPSVVVRLGNTGTPTGAGTFRAPISVLSSSNVVATALSDLNGDGKLDAILSIGTDVAVRIGNGDGTFNAETSYAVGANTRKIFTGDFNADGNADFAGGSNNGLTVFLGDGSGGFSAIASYSLGTPATYGDFTVVDVDRDGIVDVLASDSAISASAYFLRGNADGSFDAPISFGTPVVNSRLAAADFNRDGIIDVIVSDSGTDAVLLGNGDGTFAFGMTIGGFSAPASVRIGDFNNDGKLDTLHADSGVASLYLTLGNGDGTFKAPTSLTGISNPLESVLKDIDGDGNLDIVATDSDTTKTYIMLGNGDGTFAYAASYFFGANIESVAVGDLNNDGALDVVVGDGGDTQFGVFLGNSLNDSSDPTPAQSYLALFSGNGDGSFNSAVTLVSTAVYGMAKGDFNNDGNEDVLFTQGNLNVGLLLSNGDGTFAVSTAFTGYNDIRKVAVGNFYGNGDIDAVAVDPSSGITIGRGSTVTPGTFVPSVPVAGPVAYISQVRVEDLDSDGHDDLILSGADTQKLYVMHGNGDGTFLAAVSYRAGFTPQDFILTDVDGDDVLDAVVGDGDGKVSVLLGNAGSGTFQAPISFQAGVNISTLGAGDINGDNAVDLVTGSLGSGRSGVLRGNTKIVPDGFVPEFVNGSSNSDPLHHSLRTRGGATIAYETLKKLKADIAKDAESVNGILGELIGAARFAVEGDIAVRALSGALTTAGDAQALAEKLQQKIRSGSHDVRLAEHSSLDTALVKKLIG